MNILVKKVSRCLWLTQFFVIMTASWSCYGHDWQVHMAITESAYQSSDGLQTFLSDNLEAQELSASSSDYGVVGTLSPLEWLKWGSKMEDEQVYGYFINPIAPRPLDHFYTLTPDRTPGQVLGITEPTFWSLKRTNNMRGVTVSRSRCPAAGVWGWQLARPYGAMNR